MVLRSVGLMGAHQFGFKQGRPLVSIARSSVARVFAPTRSPLAPLVGQSPRIKKFGPCMRLDYPNVNSDLFRAHSSHDLPLDCHTFLAPCQISSMIAVTRRTVRAGSTLRFPLDTSTVIALTLVDVGQRTNRSFSCGTQHFDQQRMSSALVQSRVCARLR